MIINLNAGHGPNDVRGFLQVDKLDECSEGQNNYRVYELVRKGLQQYQDVTVTTARPAMSDNPGLTTRGLSGKGADLQLHLHSNAGGGRGPEILLRPDASDGAVALAKEIRAGIQAEGTCHLGPLNSLFLMIKVELIGNSQEEQEKATLPSCDTQRPRMRSWSRWHFTTTPRKLGCCVRNDRRSLTLLLRQLQYITN